MWEVHLFHRLCEMDAPKTVDLSFLELTCVCTSIGEEHCRKDIALHQAVVKGSLVFHPAMREVPCGCPYPSVCRWESHLAFLHGALRTDPVKFPSITELHLAIAMGLSIFSRK